MREVKFRGKRVDNGEWVYGYYFFHKGDIFQGETAYIITSIIEVDDFDYCFVKPETVGEYTGLKDKNGKDIYEGDIITFISTSILKSLLGENLKDRECTIEWKDCGWWISDGETGFVPDLETDDNKLEITGNIYENIKEQSQQHDSK